MPDLAKIILKNHKIDAVKRFHPWIFSGAIKEMAGEVKEGAIVEVYSDRGEYLATGLYNPSNIAVKILSFQKVSDIAQLFLEKFQNAYQLRQQIGLVDNPKTNCYRLINAEGDGLPSLIVDWYNGTAVIQAYSLALYQRLDLIVDSVDSSHGAIDLTEKNIALNNLSEVPHQSYSTDVFNFLRDCQEDYDLIVLDPPAFAKSIQSRHQAVMAYKRLNQQAFQKIRPQGIIFTFSCSQVVNEEHFQGAVMAAAIESARPVRILARLSQPADHPTSIYHSEGSYLKGLVLAVD